jgi:serine/threonine protein kinase
LTDPLLSTRFTLLRKLGSGGFGAVFEAVDRARDQRVALKKLVRMDPAAIYRFKQEFRALAEVRHPNLVRLHELFCDDGEWYITMDLVDGADLHAWLRGASTSEPRPPSAQVGHAQVGHALDDATQPLENRTTAPSMSIPSTPAPRSGRSIPWRLDEARIRAVFPQVALGVQALHEARWLHRDLKPSNAMVTHDGRAVLLDFGLVASTQADAQPSFDHEVIGTPTYMSPEQACDGPVTAASDWYAFGVMLYEALTGSAPFTGSMFQVLHHKCTREPPDPRPSRPGLPDDLVELCLALLSLNPEQRPTGAEVLRRLSPDRGSFEPPSSRSRELPFVGRSRHLDALRARLADARAGRATFVEVSGRSGMGKSALARHFLAELGADPDALVLRGRCHAHEAVPYKAFDGVVDGLTRHLRTLGAARSSVIPDDAMAILARLFPAFARLPRESAADEAPPARDAAELRRLAFAALQRGLTRLAARGTVAIVVDDLQWGDADSAALLVELLAPPSAPPVLFVACHRTEETTAGPMLRLLRDARDRGALAEPFVVEVGPLDDDDAFDLARALLPEAPEAAVRAVVREAGGNALFVRELARSVAAGGEAEGALTLAGVLGARVERLPPDARTLLGVVALAGHPVDERLARDAASLDGVAFDRALRVLLTAQLLRSGGAGARSTLEARHDAIRDAALVGLSPESLAVLHRSLARVLAVDPHTEPDALALHLRALGEHAEAQRLDELAGDRAADALAFDRAAALFRRALTPDAPPHARALRVKLGDALAHAGVGGEAARAYLLAAVDSDPAAALELERRAAEQLLRSGHVDEGVEVIRSVLDALGMGFPASPAAARASLDARRASLDAPAGRALAVHDPSALARLEVCWSVGNGLGGVSPVVGADFHARHVELALRGGDDYQVARALSWGAMLAAMEGGAGALRAEALAERAEEMAERAGHPHGLGWSVAAAAVTAFCEGRWRRAAQLSEYGSALFRERCVDVAWELGELEVRWHLPACAYRGELHVLAERSAQAAREAAARGDRYNLTNVRTTLLPLVHLSRDQAVEARRGVTEAIASWSSSGFHLQHGNAGLALAMVDLYEARPERAHAGLTALRRHLDAAQLMELLTVRATWHHLRGLAAAAAAGAHVGAPRRALLREAIASARALRAEGREWTDGLALAVAGAAHRARGGALRTAEAWRRAEAQFVATDMALHAMAARRALAQLTGDADSAAAAERSMRERGVAAPARWCSLVVGGDGR